jgi:hypothetical protein
MLDAGEAPAPAPAHPGKDEVQLARLPWPLSLPPVVLAAPVGPGQSRGRRGIQRGTARV